MALKVTATGWGAILVVVEFAFAAIGLYATVAWLIG